MTQIAGGADWSDWQEKTICPSAVKDGCVLKHVCGAPMFVLSWHAGSRYRRFLPSVSIVPMPGGKKPFGAGDFFAPRREQDGVPVASPGAGLSERERLLPTAVGVDQQDFLA